MVYTAIYRYSECDILSLKKNLNISQGARSLHRDESSWGPTKSQNLVFLGVLGANHQGVVSTPPPLAGRVVGKGLAGRGLTRFLEMV